MGLKVIVGAHSVFRQNLIYGFTPFAAKMFVFYVDTIIWTDVATMVAMQGGILLRLSTHRFGWFRYPKGRRAVRYTRRLFIGQEVTFVTPARCYAGGMQQIVVCCRF